MRSRDRDTGETRLPAPVDGEHRPVVVATLMRPEGETGVQAHFNAFLRAARESGIAVRLATPFDLPAAVVLAVMGPGRLVRPVGRSLWVWWYRAGHFALLRRRLMEQLDRGVPAVVYAQDPLSARAALDARARGYPVEVVLAVHFNVSQAEEWAERGCIRRDGWIYRRIAELERRVLTRVDRLVFPSRFMMDEVTRRIPGVEGIPSRCIPNFVHPRGPEREGPPRAELISIGTLEPRKNPEFLLHVLRECHRAGRPYRLTFAGDGPLRGELIRLSREMGLAGHVRFPGHVDGAAGLLPGHRAYVHAARMENLPISIIEALAAGMPVFAAPVGGVPELFRDGVEGRYWSLDDPQAAARALTELLECPERYACAAAAARARYQERFTPERVMPRLMAAVLGARPGSIAAERLVPCPS